MTALFATALWFVGEVDIDALEPKPTRPPPVFGSLDTPLTDAATLPAEDTLRLMANGRVIGDPVKPYSDWPGI